MYISYNDLLKPSNKEILPKAMDVRDHPSRKLPNSAYWNYTHDMPQPTHSPLGEGIPRSDRSMAAEEQNHWNSEMRNDEVN